MAGISETKLPPVQYPRLNSIQRPSFGKIVIFCAAVLDAAGRGQYNPPTFRADWR
jgi:hypothetical protein